MLLRTGDAVSDGRARAALREALTRGPWLSLAALVVTAGTSAALVYVYICGQYLGRPYPFSTFLYAPGDHFADYYNVYAQAAAFRGASGDVVVYSPFLHAVMTVATALPARVGFAALVLVFLATVAATFWIVSARSLAGVLPRLQAVVPLTLLSYPVLFALDRGNLEMLVFVFVAAFLYLYCLRGSRWAWVPLALAIAAKYYWATLLVLPLLDRQYRQALLAFAGALVASAAGLILVIAATGASLAGFVNVWATSLGGYGLWRGSVFYVHHAHGLWGVVMLLNRATDYILSRQQHLEVLYLALMAALFVLVVVVLRRGGYETWEKVAVLVLCAIVMPFENADYTLLEWMLVFALFAWRAPVGWRAGALAVLFSVTAVPFPYYYFPIVGRPDVGISTLIYPAALVGAGMLILTRPGRVRPDDPQPGEGCA